MILDHPLSVPKPVTSSTGREPEDGPPPAYSRAPPIASASTRPPRTLSIARNRQGVVPFTTPVNGLYMYSKRETIRGSWTIDPMAPVVPEQNLVQMFLYGQAEKKKRWGRSRNPKAAPPTAKFGTRHGNIQATLRVVGDSMVRSIATIRAESRKGNIVLDLASIAPMRTVHMDAYSRKGSVTLLVPRSFCGLIQLDSRHGAVELLPALAATCRVITTKNKETTVLLGDGPMPHVGSNNITDTARISSRHGPVRLGFSGEDYFTERSGLVEHAMQLVQKFIVPKIQRSFS